MSRNVLAALFAATAMLSANVFAQQASPAGLWKNIDDQTGKPRALIRITESNGEYSGKVERLFMEAGDDQNPKCISCSGALKNQPILGMTILTGMRQEGADYAGGHILDPSSGRNYKSKMSLLEDGKRLDVRGYIGMPTFGRSQTWLRVE